MIYCSYGYGEENSVIPKDIFEILLTCLPMAVASFFLPIELGLAQ